MVYVTLGAALAKNQALLGQSFDRLGSKEAAYLAFDAKAGWSVQTLCCGWALKLLRHLGFYSSTRLAHVVAQLQNEKDLPEALFTKIQSCWHRATGKPFAIRKPSPSPAAPAAPAPQAPRVSSPRPPSQVLSKEFMGTHISFIHGDITQVRGVDAIVTAANPTFLGGGGVDGAIHKAAGPDLRAACLQLPELSPGVRCEEGSAVITSSGNLNRRLGDRRIPWVIHAVGPKYGPWNTVATNFRLSRAYASSLEVAEQNGVRSIAFPLISAGAYGYPFDEAVTCALEGIFHYIRQHQGKVPAIQIILSDDTVDQVRPIFDKVHSEQLA